LAALRTAVVANSTAGAGTIAQRPFLSPQEELDEVMARTRAGRLCSRKNDGELSEVPVLGEAPEPNTLALGRETFGDAD